MTDLAQRLAELRESFDREFAQPAMVPEERGDEFLIMGTKAGRFAIALNSLLGLESRRKVVPVPLTTPGLLGLAGFRGHIIPVFDLASLLGAETGAAPPWLAICKVEEGIGLAFDRLDGSARIQSQEIFALAPGEQARRLTRQAFRSETGMVPIIDVPSLAAAVTQRLREEAK